MAFGVEHLNGVPAAEVISEVDGDGGRNRDVLGGLNYTTGDFDETEDSPEIAAEDNFRNKEGNVGSHIEESPAEFLYGSGNIGTDSERGKAVDPRLVISFHCSENPVNLTLFEPTMVVAVVEKPKRNEKRILEENRGKTE